MTLLGSLMHRAQGSDWQTQANNIEKESSLCELSTQVCNQDAWPWRNTRAWLQTHQGLSIEQINCSNPVPVAPFCDLCYLTHTSDPKWEEQWEYLKGTWSAPVTLSEHFHSNSTTLFENYQWYFWSTTMILPYVATALPDHRTSKKNYSSKTACFLLSSGGGMKMEGMLQVMVHHRLVDIRKDQHCSINVYILLLG